MAHNSHQRQVRGVRQLSEHVGCAVAGRRRSAARGGGVQVARPPARARLDQPALAGRHHQVQPAARRGERAHLYLNSITTYYIISVYIDVKEALEVYKCHTT